MAVGPDRLSAAEAPGIAASARSKSKKRAPEVRPLRRTKSAMKEVQATGHQRVVNLRHPGWEGSDDYDHKSLGLCITAQGGGRLRAGRPLLPRTQSPPQPDRVRRTQPLGRDAPGRVNYFLEPSLEIGRGRLG
jgi:hypothetical protein